MSSQAPLLTTLLDLAVGNKNAVLVLKNGERHHVKITACDGQHVTAVARCLYYNPETSKQGQALAMENEKNHELSPGQNPHGLTMADAIEKFGRNAHLFRFFIDCSDIVCIAVDADDSINETPCFASLH